MSENDAPTSAERPDAAALAALPDKLRVHALARLVGSSSREVLALLTRFEVAARSAQSSVDRATVSQVVEHFFPSAPPEPAPAPVQETLPEIDGEHVVPADTGDSAPRPTTSASATPTAPAALFLAPGSASAAAAAPASSGTPASEEGESGGGRRRRRGSRSGGVVTPDRDAATETPAEATPDEETADSSGSSRESTTGPADTDTDDDTDEGGRRRRRRGRRGRGRGRGGDDASDADESEDTGDANASDADSDDADANDANSNDANSNDADANDDDADEGEDATEDGGSGESGSSRRRRRRRRRGSDDSSSTNDDPPNTVTHVREKSEPKNEPRRSSDDEVKGVKGSTRLEAKRQRRRDGREAGRRRPSILSESEFLARREAVERTMVVRQQADRNQIGVLEDGVLVEHFVAGSGQNSMVGNVYLGRVQNVLPSMEAAFVDIGRGRNAVLYAGEVNWDAAGLEGKQRKIEQALSSGDAVLVQVTKDPVGHKGARLTTQISLPGRFLVYVPGGGATGISRKLPEPERKRLKEILKRIVPDEAGVIIRTAAEGVEEAELEADVRRLAAQWEVIAATGEGKGKSKPKAPSLVHEEPDLLIRVVRDMFNEDFSSLVISGEQAWETLEGYISHVAPELVPRLSRHLGPEDVFSAHRIDEQLVKALDRKVWLPSGGTLVIDRTEAMTVVDVNTGKFTGSGGNLEETVTRNNLEAAEEVVRQLRLRDIGGMIVIDFIDMVLESNRDLVLRRLTECLGRDRTRHQVAEVTSLGLVQMTRKRVGQGLLDEFSTVCEHCKGRGVIVSSEPVLGSNGHSHEPARAAASGGSGDAGSNGTGESSGSAGSNGAGSSGRRRGRGRRGASSEGGSPTTVAASANGHTGPVPSPADVAARRSSADEDEAPAGSDTDGPTTAPDATAADGGSTETVATDSAATESAVTGSAATESAVAESAVAETVAEEPVAAETAGTEVAAAETGAAEEPEADAAESGAVEPGAVGTGGAGTGGAGTGAAGTGAAGTDGPVTEVDGAEQPEVALEADLAEESTGGTGPGGSEGSPAPVSERAERPEETEEPFITGRIGAMAPPKPVEPEEADEPEAATVVVGNGAPVPKRTRRRAASRPAGPPVAVGGN